MEVWGHKECSEMKGIMEIGLGDRVVWSLIMNGIDVRKLRKV